MKTRNQPLDILRGIAILLVIGHHFPYFRILYQIGWSGVDLFFVLSGFLVSGLLFSEYQKRGNLNITRFWIRRGFKIYPAFYFLMLLTLFALLEIHKLDIRKMLAGIFFLQSYLPHIWGHAWSLSVEEHFYFLLPLLLLAIVKVSPNKANPFTSVPWVFLFLATACLTLRYIGFLHGLSGFTLHSETHLRVDGLFFGVTLSYFYYFHRERFQSVAKKPIWLLSIPLLIPMTFMPMNGEFMDTFGLTVIYLGYGCLLLWSVGLPASKNPVARFVAWIGKYSYSIYLWHIPLRECLYRGHVSFEFFVVGTIASIFFGVLMAKLIEFPGLKIRDKMFPQFGRGTASSYLVGEPRTNLQRGIA